MDLFDIIGPVMVGPSSSHTAGAARIGKITRMLLGSRPVRARIGLYGSFQKTYLGHGTDLSLIHIFNFSNSTPQQIHEGMGKLRELFAGHLG